MADAMESVSGLLCPITYIFLTITAPLSVLIPESDRIPSIIDFSVQSCTKFFSQRNDFLLGQTLFLGPSRYTGGNSLLDLALTFLQRRPQTNHGRFAVLCLGAALGGLRHDTGGKMTDAYRGVRSVPVLPTRTGCPVKF